MTPVRPGETIDHYRIENVGARSGSAAIFRAIHLNDGKQVAIKVPHPEMESDAALYERFQREGEIGRIMDHPGVMKVYDREKHNRVYMVMEWAPGKLLAPVLQRDQTLPKERAIKIAVNILHALESIHSRGVAHRDLKPENIMLDDDDNIKLINFGM